MAIADATAYDAVLRETWHPDAIEKNIYTASPTLDMIEKRLPTQEVGDTALTPVQTDLAGGYSVVPRTGSSNLNAADAVSLNQASWNYTHHIKQIQIETATVDETSNSSLAVASAVDTEMEGATDTIRRQITRQIFGNGDALIAACDTTAGSTEVELLSTGYGYDAIVRGWLHAGLSVDIGTTADEDNVVAGAVIQSVEEDSSTPSITIDSSVSTDSSDYVSIENARSGTTSYEMNGFRNMFGSTTTVIGGLDPSSVSRWVPAYVDSSSTSLTLPLIYRQVREVVQRTGNRPDWCLTSLKQCEAAFKLVQPQMRFSGNENLNSGDSLSFTIPGVGKIDGVPDCPDRSWFTLSKKHLFMVRRKKPHWQNEYTGGSKILEWNQDTTRLVAALFYRLQLATDRRNAHSSLTALTD